jgi:hypothetical protein
VGLLLELKDLVSIEIDRPNMFIEVVIHCRGQEPPEDLDAVSNALNVIVEAGVFVFEALHALDRGLDALQEKLVVGRLLGVFYGVHDVLLAVQAGQEVGCYLDHYVRIHSFGGCFHLQTLGENIRSKFPDQFRDRGSRLGLFLDISSRSCLARGGA